MAPPHPCSFNASHSSSTAATQSPHFYYSDNNNFDQEKSPLTFYNLPTSSWTWNNRSTADDLDFDPTTMTATMDESSSSELAQHLNTLNKVAYFYITPIIIGFGIVGDVLSIAVLSHPLLRKTSVVYSYLLALAVTDLLTLVSVIPPILWIMKIKFCTLAAARYYAHVGFPLANAFMGASVYIVVFLTFNQYMAVCHPFIRSDFIRSKRNCLVLTLVAYALSFALYVPWAWRKNVRYVGQLHSTFQDCNYEACDNHSVVDSSWYKAYQWAREMISRFVPFLLIAYFNLRMLYVYRRTRAQRMSVVSLREQKLTIRQKTEREQRRLWALLFGIMTLFFVCTIPAAPFTIMVSDRLESNLTFQTIRAITNVLEFTKFALNFYLYCMINPDIRRLCVKRLTCQSSINSVRAPMVASRNSYHLSDLLQMSERKHHQRQLPPNYQHHRKSATVTGTGSYEFNSHRQRRSFRSRQDSERPLLTKVISRNLSERDNSPRYDDLEDSPRDSATTTRGSPATAVEDGSRRNGSVLAELRHSETDIILHEEPINASSSWASYAGMFTDDISDNDFDCSNGSAACDTLTKVTSNM